MKWETMNLIGVRLITTVTILIVLFALQLMYTLPHE